MNLKAVCFKPGNHRFCCAQTCSKELWFIVKKVSKYSEYIQISYLRKKTQFFFQSKFDIFNVKEEDLERLFNQTKIGVNSPNHSAEQR